MSVRNSFFLCCFALLCLVILSGCGWFNNDDGEEEEGYPGVIVIQVPANGM